MIRNFILSLVALLSISTFASAQTLGTTTDKDAVKAFGLDIIKNYFNNYDCNILYNALHTTLVSFESGQVYQKDAALKTALCDRNGNPVRTDITTSFKAYNLNYKVEVMDFATFSQKFPGVATQVGAQAGDYFFDGSQLASSSSTTLFTSGDMARFLVRKVGGVWKIYSM